MNPYKHKKPLAARCDRNLDIVFPQPFGKQKYAMSGTFVEMPEDSTFHELYIESAREVFGGEWYRDQEALTEGQHILFIWIQQFLECTKNNHSPENLVDGIYTAPFTGNIKTLMDLAYSIFVLKNMDNWEDFLADDLKDKSKFKGSRAEILIAAIFVNANYDLTWFDHRTENKSRPEFYAIHKENSSRKIFVEVKSRQRDGRLGHGSNSADDTKELTLEEFEKDLVPIFTGSGKKRGVFQKEVDDNPYIVFIDMNLPNKFINDHFETEADFKKLCEALAQNLKYVKGDLSVENTDFAKISAIVFTNFSDHHDEENTLSGKSSLILTLNPSAELPLTKEEISLLNLVFGEFGDYPVYKQLLDI